MRSKTMAVANEWIQRGRDLQTRDEAKQLLREVREALPPEAPALAVLVEDDECAPVVRRAALDRCVELRRPEPARLPGVHAWLDGLTRSVQDGEVRRRAFEWLATLSAVRSPAPPAMEGTG